MIGFESSTSSTFLQVVSGLSASYRWACLRMALGPAPIERFAIGTLWGWHPCGLPLFHGSRFPANSDCPWATYRERRHSQSFQGKTALSLSALPNSCEIEYSKVAPISLAVLIPFLCLSLASLIWY